MLLTDYVSQKLGTTEWFIGKRLTSRTREKGYSVALSPKNYEKFKEEWERMEYGAPLESLKRAAPRLLAALRLFVDDHNSRLTGLPEYSLEEKIGVARVALLAAGADLEVPPAKPIRIGTEKERIPVDSVLVALPRQAA